MRSSRRVVVHPVVGPRTAPLATDRVAGVGIDVEARKIRTRDIEADAMAGDEEIARRVERDDDFSHLARR